MTEEQRLQLIDLLASLRYMRSHWANKCDLAGVTNERIRLLQELVQRPVAATDAPAKPPVSKPLKKRSIALVKEEET